MEPCSSKDPWCPYCERSHEGPCFIGTPQKKKQSVVLTQVVAPPETPKKQKSFHCEQCGKVFETRGKMTQHKISHTGEKKYSCEYCGKAFSSKFKLVRHMVVHSKVREWECEACGTGFRRKDHLEAHLRQHCGKRTVYPCPHCTKTYSCKGSLRKHLALHSAQSGNLKCQLCQHVAADKEAILQHTRSHTGSRIMFWLYPEYIWQKIQILTVELVLQEAVIEITQTRHINPIHTCFGNRSGRSMSL